MWLRKVNEGGLFGFFLMCFFFACLLLLSNEFEFQSVYAKLVGMEWFCVT